MSDHKMIFSPDWKDDIRCSPYLVRLASGLIDTVLVEPETKLGPTIDDIEEAFLRDIRSNFLPSESHRLEAAGHILIDLARQGWAIEVEDNVVVLNQKDEQSLTVQGQKLRIREQELIKRNEQLRTPSVRRFIQDMESSKLHKDEFVSVFSLMRDGEELAEALRAKGYAVQQN